MDIWILVIILVVIAIILMIASFFADNDLDEVEEQIDEYTAQQSEELFTIKQRLTDLEQYIASGEGQDVLVAQPAEVEMVLEPVSAEARDQIIQYYSQGYTMHEISQSVNLNTLTIQKVVDDYIENR
ncbi:hypothetical protein [Hutsoniella sourekii]|uniref:hypothetical protein n=1 Tax=Hutsoniella sourekii TaxID=87650 RepID=UPI00047FA2BE|nr:hypothetical protein [Hutsoniella sourekii]